MKKNQKKFRYYIFLFILMVALVTQIFFDISRTNIHKWSEQPLKWDHFEPSSWLPNKLAITIKTSIKYNINISEKKAIVFAYMNKDLSLVLDTIHRTDRMLIHEQYHFNLTEIYARLMRKELIEIGEDKITTDTAMKLLNKYGKNLVKTQMEYDSVTEHGEIKNLQLKWQNKIDSLLFASRSFKEINLYNYPQFLKN